MNGYRKSETIACNEYICPRAELAKSIRANEVIAAGLAEVVVSRLTPPPAKVLIGTVVPGFTSAVDEMKAEKKRREKGLAARLDAKH